MINISFFLDFAGDLSTTEIRLLRKLFRAYENSFTA